MALIEDQLSWEEIQQHLDYFKEHGVIQFINLMKAAEVRTNFPFKWGDETECTLVHFGKNKAFAACRSAELIPLLQKETGDTLVGGANWTTELDLFQLESTPGVPFEGFLDCFNIVEKNMRSRRQQVLKHLAPNERLLTISFPSIGTKGFTKPFTEPNPDENMTSIFLSDEVVHPAYAHFMTVVDARRGTKPSINVPIFRDENTPNPYIEKLTPLASKEDVEAAKKNHIYMDHLSLGLGYCCLQITMQAKDFEEACFLYDQLTPLSPILLALSASSPIYRSTLSDVDVRWDVMAQAIDDRTPEEKGLKPLENGSFKITSTRYGTAECFIAHSSEKYNDIQLPFDQKIMQRLLDAGIDKVFSRYIANLFTRDHLKVARGRIVLNDTYEFEHCEKLFTSIWNNLRLKLPIMSDPNSGWRVEFRPMEIQISDFQNAALACFVVLCSRMITMNSMNLLVPISRVVENMKRAQNRDAVRVEKFYFRKDLSNCCDGFKEMSVDEIVNGKIGGFIGLIPLISQFLDSQNVKPKARLRIDRYLSFISKRAIGEEPTVAKWIREFVTKHPKYKKDSHVPDETIFDMLKEIDNFSLSE